MAYRIGYRGIDMDYEELIIFHDDKEIASYCDGGEPEDNFFLRDWSWVASELKRAYELGMQDAKKQEVK